MASIRTTAAASTGTSSTRIRLLPFTKRRSNCSATAAKRSKLVAWSTGMSTAPTKPGSELGSMKALAGQSVPQVAQGLGSG